MSILLTDIGIFANTCVITPLMDTWTRTDINMTDSFQSKTDFENWVSRPLRHKNS